MRIFAPLIALTVAGCAGVLPEPGAPPASHRLSLAPCPQWPNCVSSDATAPMHAILPFRLSVPAEQGWAALREAVRQLPGTEIVADTGTYLRAESRTPLGFIDDLELQLRPGGQVVAVRSASRIGLNDLGSNGRRVEALRDRLLREAVVR
jgi:uncharacterized protein (DUF1499 family)